MALIYWDLWIIRLLSILTVIGNAVVVLYLFNFFNKNFGRRFFSYLKRKALFLIFLVSFTATAGSLIFSEILNFNPCVLCWYQRIFIYPQPFISALALYKKQKGIISYLALLSLFGILIAGAHYSGQIFSESIKLPCSAVGISASCNENFFLTFGYITIPFMSFSVFALVLMLWHLTKRADLG